jgi:hypothetical protein
MSLEPNFGLMSVKSTLLASYFVFVAALVVLGGWSAWRLHDLGGASRRIIADNYASVVAAQQMKESLATCRSPCATPVMESQPTGSLVSSRSSAACLAWRRAGPVWASRSPGTLSRRTAAESGYSPNPAAAPCFGGSRTCAARRDGLLARAERARAGAPRLDARGAGAGRTAGHLRADRRHRQGRACERRMTVRSAAFSSAWRLT